MNATAAIAALWLIVGIGCVLFFRAGHVYTGAGPYRALYGALLTVLAAPLALALVAAAWCWETAERVGRWLERA